MSKPVSLFIYFYIYFISNFRAIKACEPPQANTTPTRCFHFWAECAAESVLVKEMAMWFGCWALKARSMYASNSYHTCPVKATLTASVSSDSDECGVLRTGVLRLCYVQRRDLLVPEESSTMALSCDTVGRVLQGSRCGEQLSCTCTLGGQKTYHAIAV